MKAFLVRLSSLPMTVYVRLSDDEPDEVAERIGFEQWIKDSKMAIDIFPIPEAALLNRDDVMDSKGSRASLEEALAQRLKRRNLNPSS